jgi:hypothetical protein
MPPCRLPLGCCRRNLQGLAKLGRRQVWEMLRYRCEQLALRSACRDQVSDLRGDCGRVSHGQLLGFGLMNSRVVKKLDRRKNL